MATKKLRFDSIPLGSAFTNTITVQNADGQQNVTIQYVKTAARKARRSDVEGSIEFAVKPSAYVDVQVPDPVPPTPEEAAADRTAWLQRRLQAWIATGVEAQREFAKHAGEDALAAIEWQAEGTLRDMHRAKVATQIKAGLDEHRMGEERTIQWISEKVVNGARWPERSTSPMRNLSSVAELAAYAELLSEYRDRV